MGNSTAGCTANVILLVGKTLYCANAGDARSVIWCENESVALSKDHKPEDFTERERITKAGGTIMMGRVNGNLNLSRALGDFEYKQDSSIKPEEQLISCEPDIVVR